MRAATPTRPQSPLVERAASGDKAAFGALIANYDQRLRALAYTLLAGDAAAMDDVLQDAYLKAYVALPNFRHGADPGTWLYRIVYNASIDELRRRRRRPKPVDTTETSVDWASTRSGPEAEVGAMDATLRALDALPEIQRIVLVLVDGHGFDTQTVADMLDIAHGTVRSRLSRARATARQILTEETR